MANDTGNATPHSVDDETLVGLAPAALTAALGEQTAAFVHAANNGLYAILAQAELLEGDPGLPDAAAERVGLLADSAEALAELARAVGSLARGVPDGMDEAVRAALRLPGLASLETMLPATPLPGAGDAAKVVFLALVHVAAVDPRASVAMTVQDGTTVLSAAYATQREPRDGGLGLAVAGALARRLGGALELPAAGTLRLRLPH